MLRGLLLSGLGGATHSPEGLSSLWSLFSALRDFGSPLSQKGWFLPHGGSRGLDQLSGSCPGLDALLQRKVLDRIFKMGYHWLACLSKTNVTYLYSAICFVGA